LKLKDTVTTMRPLRVSLRLDSEEPEKAMNLKNSAVPNVKTSVDYRHTSK